jgi:hypothetical protein
MVKSHLATLDFTQSDVPAIFQNSPPWHNIPPLAIVIGAPGAGKSQLLKYITTFSSRHVFYVGAETLQNANFASLLNIVIGNPDDHTRHLETLSKIFHGSAATQHEWDDIKLLLLDEPDRDLEHPHLSLFYQMVQKLAMHNMQIIMTTNRPDMLALAYAEPIFTIKKDTTGLRYIKPTTPANALFSLTSTLTRPQIRVHVEGITDARFYTAIYRQLFSLSETERGHNSIDYKWELLRAHLRQPVLARLLSRRYQLQFHSTACDDLGLNGGISAVLDSVKRDYHAEHVRNKARRQSLPPTSQNAQMQILHHLTSQSFGIIDEDGKGEDAVNEALSVVCRKRPAREIEAKKRASEAIKSFIVAARGRYTLENYSYDPLVVCSALTDDDIARIEDKNMKEICTKLKAALHYLDTKKIQEYLTKYVDYWLEFVNKRHREDQSETLPLGQDEEAKMMLQDSCIVSFRYNTNFLHCKGHNLEAMVTGGRYISLVDELFFPQFKQHLFARIENAESLCLPIDLVEMLLELNARVRAHMTQYIKPAPSAALSYTAFLATQAEDAALAAGSSTSL